MKKKTKKILSAVLAVLVLVTMFTGIIGTVTAHAAPSESVAVTKTTSVNSKTDNGKSATSKNSTSAAESTEQETKVSSNKSPSSILLNNIVDKGTTLDNSKEPEESAKETIKETVKDTVKDNPSSNVITEDTITTGTDDEEIPEDDFITLTINNIKQTGDSKTVVNVVVKNMDTKEVVDIQFVEGNSFTSKAFLEPGVYKVKSISSNDYTTIKVKTKDFTIAEDTTKVSLELKRCQVNEGFLRNFLRNNTFFLILLVALSVGLVIIKKKKENELTK